MEMISRQVDGAGCRLAPAAVALRGVSVGRARGGGHSSKLYSTRRSTWRSGLALSVRAGSEAVMRVVTFERSHGSTVILPHNPQVAQTFPPTVATDVDVLVPAHASVPAGTC